MALGSVQQRLRRFFHLRYLPGVPPTWRLLRLAATQVRGCHDKRNGGTGTVGGRVAGAATGSVCAHYEVERTVRVLMKVAASNVDTGGSSETPQGRRTQFGLTLASCIGASVGARSSNHHISCFPRRPWHFPISFKFDPSTVFCGSPGTQARMQAARNAFRPAGAMCSLWLPRVAEVSVSARCLAPVARHGSRCMSTTTPARVRLSQPVVRSAAVSTAVAAAFGMAWVSASPSVALAAGMGPVTTPGRRAMSSQARRAMRYAVLAAPAQEEFAKVR